MKRPNRSKGDYSKSSGSFINMDSTFHSSPSSSMHSTTREHHAFTRTHSQTKAINGYNSSSSVGSHDSLTTSLLNLNPGGGAGPPLDNAEHSDGLNYALLIALYTIQGIPMGLSASIPFLIQQKITNLAKLAASASADVAASTVSSTHHAHHASVAKMAYNSQAIFALCSWPFSLKLFWAPIVDAVFSNRFGRRKSWLIPVQTLAGGMMIWGSDYVETQLGLSSTSVLPKTDGLVDSTFDVKGVTIFFFVLYFLMATQDIAVDGWALTMLSKANRGRGPVCNSIGQNLGYFFSFVGFLALNDPESSENLWRPLLRLKSNPGVGLVSLGGFIRFMGFCTLLITTFIAIFKHENDFNHDSMQDGNDDDPPELDASEIGIRETYKRLLALCKLPAVRSLFLILLTYRLPTALSDNVKFLKAVEFGLSKQTTALLSPTIILPLGIAVPIVASKIWHGHPLKQFLAAYKFRIYIVPIFDVCMLLMVRKVKEQMNEADLTFGLQMLFWGLLVGSTAFQTIVHSLQFNAQMTFFASRVDPAIGGSYMTLLNTAANLGGTWPASVVMFLMSKFTVPDVCEISSNGEEICHGGKDAYFPLQIIFSILGMVWLFFFGGRVQEVSNLSESSWRTGLGMESENDEIIERNGIRKKLFARKSSLEMIDMEKGGSKGKANKKAK